MRIIWQEFSFKCYYFDIYFHLYQLIQCWLASFYTFIWNTYILFGGLLHCSGILALIVSIWIAQVYCTNHIHLICSGIFALIISIWFAQVYCTNHISHIHSHHFFEHAAITAARFTLRLWWGGIGCLAWSGFTWWAWGWRLLHSTFAHTWWPWCSDCGRWHSRLDLRTSGGRSWCHHWLVRSWVCRLDLWSNVATVAAILLAPSCLNFIGPAWQLFLYHGLLPFFLSYLKRLHSHIVTNVQTFEVFVTFLGLFCPASFLDSTLSFQIVVSWLQLCVSHGQSTFCATAHEPLGRAGAHRIAEGSIMVISSNMEPSTTFTTMH